MDGCQPFVQDLTDQCCKLLLGMLQLSSQRIPLLRQLSAEQSKGITEGVFQTKART